MTGNIGAALALALGGLVCLFGYRLVRVTVVLAGVLVGVAVGAGAVGLIPDSGQLAVLIAGAVGGVIGGILAAVLYKVGVFLLGAGGGALVAAVVIGLLGFAATPVVLVAAGVAGGVLALIAQRFIVSVLTAFAGAWGITAGIAHLVGWCTVEAALRSPAAQRSTVPEFFVMVAIWVAFGVIGLVIQLAAGGNRKKK